MGDSEEELLRSKVVLVRWALTAEPNPDGSLPHDIYSFKIAGKRIGEHQDPLSVWLDVQGQLAKMVDILLVKQLPLTQSMRDEIESRIKIRTALTEKELREKPPSLPDNKKERLKMMRKMSGSVEEADVSSADYSPIIHPEADGSWTAHSKTYGISARGSIILGKDGIIDEEACRDDAVSKLLQELKGITSDQEGRPIVNPPIPVINRNDQFGQICSFILAETECVPRPRWDYCIVCGKPIRIYRQNSKQFYCPVDERQETRWHVDNKVVPDSRCKKIFNSIAWRSVPENRRRYNFYQQRYMQEYRKS